MNSLVILGAGGLAKEVYHHLMDIDYKRKYYFVDDCTDITELYGVEVIKDWRFPSNSEFVIGVGDPRIKRILVLRALEAGLKPSKTIVHPKALVQEASVGVGGVFCPNVIVSANIRIGDYVTLNTNSTVGHDSTLGDYVNLAPGVCISGNNHIGDFCDIGTGTVTREKISIVPHTIVGMAAGVIKDITDSGTYIGTPAKLMR